MNPTLNNLRNQIETLQAERLTIESQPRSRSEVVDYARKYIANLVKEARSEAHAFLVRVSAGGSSYAQHTDMPAVLSSGANADAVLSFLLADFDLVPVGLEPAEKARRLAAIEDRLYALETLEESEIDKIEFATGQYVPRRPDARPEIVLAITA